MLLPVGRVLAVSRKEQLFSQGGEVKGLAGAEPWACSSVTVVDVVSVSAGVSWG